MKMLDRLFIMTGVFFLLSGTAEAASNYGRSSADMVYQSRVGPNSQSAKEDRALLKDLTRYDPYMKDQFIPNYSGLTGGDSGRARTRTGYQMEKLEGLNSGELTPEQYRTTLQDFIHSRESTPQIKKNEFKYGPAIQAVPVTTPKPADAAVKKTPAKETKKSELKNPIDEYLDKLAAKQDKEKEAELKNSAGAAKEEIKKSDVSAEKKADVDNKTVPDEKVKDQSAKSGNADGKSSAAKP